MKLAYVLAIFATASVAFAGCGGGSSTSTGPGAKTTADATGTAPPAPRRPATHKRAPVTAEASIEGFGAEASGTERGLLLAAFHGYLEALSNEDLSRVCALLGESVTKGVTELVHGQAHSCPAVLKLLVPPEAAAGARSEAGGQVRKVRVKGDRAFVVFTAPGARLYQMNMVREGAAWKTAALSPSVLAPLTNVE